MDWPSKSPDLNPIEHVWDMMERSIEELEVQQNGLQLLGVALEAVWDAIDVRDVNRLINSMRQRCQAVIAAGGDSFHFSSP
jgi:transposase